MSVKRRSLSGSGSDMDDTRDDSGGSSSWGIGGDTASAWTGGFTDRYPKEPEAPPQETKPSLWAGLMKSARKEPQAVAEVEMDSFASPAFGGKHCSERLQACFRSR